MGGVYGDFLSFFPELFEDFDVFSQKPDVVSGYEVKPLRTVRGIKQSDDSKLKDWGPHTLHVVNVASAFILWTYEPFDIVNEFVRIDGKMYRPTKESFFQREGGFYETRVEAVAGNDGVNRTTPELYGGRY